METVAISYVCKKLKLTHYTAIDTLDSEGLKPVFERTSKSGRNTLRLFDKQAVDKMCQKINEEKSHKAPTCGKGYPRSELRNAIEALDQKLASILEHLTSPHTF